MKLSFGLKILVPTLALGMTCTVPVFAQDSAGTTGSTTSATGASAGEKMHQAASSAGEAVKNAYNGAKTAISDSDITAKVKAALHENKVTHGADIHVSTSDGVVTLNGTAPSRTVVRTAKYLAQETTGVREVRNDLKLNSSTQ
jgi:hyperosmotically inducible periplasmic protein